MALFQAAPYIVYTNSDFTNDNFGLAWGDVDGDGIPELLVSPVDVNGSSKAIFLDYNGSVFVTKNIIFSDDNPPDDSMTGFAIFDIDGDSKNEVIFNRSGTPNANMAVYKWHSDNNTLVYYSDITGTQDNSGDFEISIAKINNQIYIFEAIEGTAINIYSLSNYQATLVHTISDPMPTDAEYGVDVCDIDCDGHFEMAISGGHSPDKRIKFLRLMNPADITSWSDLNADLYIQNNFGDPESVVFANLECPHRWDLVVTTSIGDDPADILVYRNITNACPGCASIPTEPSAFVTWFKALAITAGVIAGGLAFKKS